MIDVDNLLNEAEKSCEEGRFADAQNLALQVQQILELPEVPFRNVPQHLLPFYARLLFVWSSSLWRTGEAQKALVYVEVLLPVLQELNDGQFMVRAIMQQAIILEKLSDYPRSLSCYQQVLALYQEQENMNGYAIALSNMGIVYEKLSEYSTARELYLKAVEINERLQIKSSLLRNYLNLGNIYRMLSDLSLSLEYYYKTLQLIDEVHWSTGLAGVLSNIGIVHVELSDYSRGLEHFFRALELEQESGRKDGVARCLGNIGNTYRLMCKYEEALDYSRRSLDILRSLGWQSSIAIALSHIGMILVETKEYSQAFEILNESLELHQRIGNKEGVAVTIGLIGRVFAAPEFTQHNPEKALALLNEAITICQEIGIKKEESTLHNVIAVLHRSCGNWQKALYHSKIHHTLSSAIFSTDVIKLAHQYAYEQKIAVLEKEQEVTDTMLARIFPKAIIPVLKKNFSPFLQEFEPASVLVADIVGFTTLSTFLTPQELMLFLNEVFTYYDSILLRYHCERIRTVGDAYIGAGGIPEANEFHAANIARAALEMLAAPLPSSALSLLPQTYQQFGLRIGLHCGKVVAGISEGLHTWQYDMYGDTVNTAGRLERSGQPGYIHCSKEFFVAMQQQGLCVQGNISPNGETYYLQL